MEVCDCCDPPKQFITKHQKYCHIHRDKIKLKRMSAAINAKETKRAKVENQAGIIIENSLHLLTRAVINEGMETDVLDAALDLIEPDLAELKQQVSFSWTFIFCIWF